MKKLIIVLVAVITVLGCSTQHVNNPESLEVWYELTEDWGDLEYELYGDSLMNELNIKF